MLNWLNQKISELRSKQITLTKVREAYLQRDSEYLKKAYKHGSNYIKRPAVGYLGEIPLQRNYDFLFREMTTIEDLQLKSYIYVAIMNIALNEKIIITDSDSEYLNTNFNLIDNIGFVTEKPKKTKSAPITFRNRVKDHIGLLEEMKREFDFYGS